MSIAAVIVAAGRGHRAGDGLPKQYRNVGDRSVLARTLEIFDTHPAINRCVVVIHCDDDAHYRAAVPFWESMEPPVPGGDTRQQSVLNGLSALENSPPELVLIHDAARPFPTPDLLNRLIERLGETDAVIPALRVTETVKRVQQDQIADTVDRTELWTAQTPQGFAYEKILKAHEQAHKDNPAQFTDDASIAEWAGLAVDVIDGEPGNTKLTTAQDFREAEQRLMSKTTEVDIRVGTGFDVHAFEPGTSVILCGVSIPFDRSLKGHSDADVAMHAATDALYGALADGDIGTHFPPSDDQWKGAASDIFLSHACELMRKRSGTLVNLDVTIICEAPKIAPHTAQMRQRLSEIMGVSQDRISVKATTTERLGFTGRGEGIAAQASVSLKLPFAPDTGTYDNRTS